METPLMEFLSKVSIVFNRCKNIIAENIKNESEITETQKMINSIQQAMKEWYVAQQYFESVSDPELVEYAVYSLEASRKKYDYLLKKAKDMGIMADCN